MPRRSGSPGTREVANRATVAYFREGREVPVLHRYPESGPSWSSMTTAEDDDRQLLGRIRQRDGTAFRTLVERHLHLVTGVARRMLRDDAEADDVAQEAMIRLWQGGGGLEIGAGGLRPWLRRVTSNLCIDRIRARSRTDVMDEVPDRPVAASQLTSLVEDDMSARVQQALLALPERQRQALVLFHYEGLSQIEVAAVLGVSDEAVESLLSRARRALRGTLKDEWRQLLPGEAGEV
ncbi:sigma-70 family RNA polymerase sigma factor [Luteitalea sp.]|uniref:sigma-70 family RNA polymerase sigma factor n=1 Tax=Luteitalea sp. TaxID=2004800 RepID=UPI0025BF642C|nr:sigma-70 family RNA polymerase sigma factor [Luteitalea sp.]